MTEEKKYKIALIEDDKILSRVITEELEEQGFEVAQAFDGEEGIKLIEEDGIDLILLDIIMPKMDGLTALKKIQENKKLKETPVIILTNVDDPKQVVDFTQMGVYDYLVKASWTIEQVVEKVKSKLGIK